MGNKQINSEFAQAACDAFCHAVDRLAMREIDLSGIGVVQASYTGDQHTGAQNVPGKAPNAQTTLLDI